MTETTTFARNADGSVSRSADTFDHPHDNLLLQALPMDLQATMRPALRTRTFEAGQVIREAGKPLSAVHFIESGLVAIVGKDGEDTQVEVATVGPEGLVGVSNLMGQAAAEHAAVALSSCTAKSVDMPVLGMLLNEHGELRHAMMRYAHQRMEQVIRLSVCNARHRLEQRLARWVLGASARLGPSKIVITHRDLARLLGVRRASVTEAMHLLEGHGAIRSNRGYLIVRDEDKLASLSCGCHVVEGWEHHAP